MNNTQLEQKFDKLELISDVNYDQIMLFQHDDLITKFGEQYSIERNEVLDIFEETKKFLYLCVMSRKNECFDIKIDDQTLILDLMWHNFILFTKDYFQFCVDQFGAILHHVPCSKAELKKKMNVVQTKGISWQEARSEDLREQLNIIEKYLGRETIEKWYIEYPQKYNLDTLNNMRKSFTAAHRINSNERGTFLEQEVNVLKVVNTPTLIEMLVDRPGDNEYCTSCGAYSSCNSC
ncbi:glycine-rich domain-containing protein [Vibrio harveyi]|uniref:hypothetical protein n=1 Tax=Vibrio harveyi TaxID=669 RepID=UPI0018F1EBC7|nr:hypothetical protein [Vibrio harveyi]